MALQYVGSNARCRGEGVSTAIQRGSFTQRRYGQNLSHRGQRHILQAGAARGTGATDRAILPQLGSPAGQHTSHPISMDVRASTDCDGENGGKKSNWKYIKTQWQFLIFQKLAIVFEIAYCPNSYTSNHFIFKQLSL